jgi:hypothetical protein
MRSGDCEVQEKFILPEMKWNMSIVALVAIYTLLIIYP